MIDFPSFPARSFARTALALLVGSITVGGSIGVQSMVLKGQAQVVPAETTPDPGASDPEVKEPTVVDEWPSLLHSPFPDVAEEAIEEAGTAEMDVEDAMTADGAVRTDTELQWTFSEGATHFRYYDRRTDASDWDDGVKLTPLDNVAAEDGKVTIAVRRRADDWIFGVEACNDSYCSPVSSAVPGGAFEPVEQPE